MRLPLQNLYDLSGESMSRSMLCMVMAIYTGHKIITGNRKEKAKKEKVTDREG